MGGESKAEEGIRFPLFHQILPILVKCVTRAWQKLLITPEYRCFVLHALLATSNLSLDKFTSNSLSYYLATNAAYTNVTLQGGCVNKKTIH